MIFPPLSQLRLWGAYERGVPNGERVVIQNIGTGVVNLGEYTLMIGIREGTMARFSRNQFFWFGEAVLPVNGWAFVYTGPGEPQRSTVTDSGAPGLIFHWGLQETVFNNPTLAPVLFRMCEVGVDLQTAVDSKALENKTR